MLEGDAQDPVYPPAVIRALKNLNKLGKEKVMDIFERHKGVLKPVVKMETLVKMEPMEPVVNMETVEPVVKMETSVNKATKKSKKTTNKDDESKKAKGGGHCSDTRFASQSAMDAAKAKFNLQIPDSAVGYGSGANGKLTKADILRMH